MKKRMLSLLLCLAFLISAVGFIPVKAATLGDPTVINDMSSVYAKGKFHIYLAIGQSNMSGRGPIEDQDYITMPGAYLFNGTKWETAQLGKSTPASTVVEGFNRYSSVKKSVKQEINPAFYFSKVMSENLKDDGIGIGIVCNARGGTSMKQWQKGYSGTEDYNLYEKAVERAKAAAAEGGVIKGVIWHQGEAGGTADDYTNDLKAIMDNLKIDLKSYLAADGELALVAGTLAGSYSTSDIYNTKIGKILNPNESSYIPKSAVACSGTGKTLSDNTHLDSQAQRDFGKAYAYKMLKLVYGIDDGKVPVSTIGKISAGGSNAGKAFDGNNNIYTTDTSSFWKAEASPNNYWKADLGASYNISEIRGYWNAPWLRTHRYKIWAKSGTKNWQLIKDNSNISVYPNLKYGEYTSDSFTNVTADQIKIETFEVVNHQSGEVRSDWIASAAEFQIFGDLKELSQPVVQTENISSDVDVYLCIGDVNMSKGSAIEESDESAISQTYLFNGSLWEIAQTWYKDNNPENSMEGFNRYSNIRNSETQGLTPAFYFAKTLAQSQAKPIGIISNAGSGNTIEMWQKNYNGGAAGNLFGSTVSRVKAALDRGGTLKGILWQNGERDVNNEQYTVLLKTLIADLRSELGVNPTVFVGTLGGYVQGSDDFNERLKGILDVPGGISDSSIVSTGQFENESEGSYSFNADAQRNIGNAYGNKVLKLNYNINNDTKLPISLSGFSKTGSTGLDADQATDGNKDIYGGNGWRGVYGQPNIWQIDLQGEYKISQIRQYWKDPWKQTNQYKIYAKRGANEWTEVIDQSNVDKYQNLQYGEYNSDILDPFIADKIKIEVTGVIGRGDTSQNLTPASAEFEIFGEKYVNIEEVSKDSLKVSAINTDGGAAATKGPEKIIDNLYSESDRWLATFVGGIAPYVIIDLGRPMLLTDMDLYLFTNRNNLTERVQVYTIEATMEEDGTGYTMVADRSSLNGYISGAKVVNSNAVLVQEQLNVRARFLKITITDSTWLSGSTKYASIGEIALRRNADDVDVQITDMSDKKANVPVELGKIDFEFTQPVDEGVINNNTVLLTRPDGGQVIEYTLSSQDYKHYTLNFGGPLAYNTVYKLNIKGVSSYGKFTIPAEITFKTSSGNPLNIFEDFSGYPVGNFVTPKWQMTNGVSGASYTIQNDGNGNNILVMPNTGTPQHALLIDDYKGRVTDYSEFLVYETKIKFSNITGQLRMRLFSDSKTTSFNFIFFREGNITLFGDSVNNKDRYIALGTYKEKVWYNIRLYCDLKNGNFLAQIIGNDGTCLESVVLDEIPFKYPANSTAGYKDIDMFSIYQSNAGVSQQVSIAKQAVYDVSTPTKMTGLKYSDNYSTVTLSYNNPVLLSGVAATIDNNPASVSLGDDGKTLVLSTTASLSGDKHIARVSGLSDIKGMELPASQLPYGNFMLGIQEINTQYNNAEKTIQMSYNVSNNMENDVPVSMIIAVTDNGKLLALSKSSEVILAGSEKDRIISGKVNAGNITPSSVVKVCFWNINNLNPYYDILQKQASELSVF